MSKYDVHVFVRYCFVPSRLDLSPQISLVPHGGLQPLGEIRAVGGYCEEVLGKSGPSESEQAEMARLEAERSPMVVFQLRGIEAADPDDAVAATESMVMLLLDIVAFHQLQRGQVCAVLVQEPSDKSAFTAFFSIPRIRKIRNLLFQSETSYLAGTMATALRDGRLRLYLSLFSEAIGERNAGFQVFKLWTVLETMALKSSGKRKKDKVRALFAQLKLPTGPIHSGRDLVDFAYAWRNAVAHEGDLEVASLGRKYAWCQPFVSKAEDHAETLRQRVRALISKYAATVPQ